MTESSDQALQNYLAELLLDSTLGSTQPELPSLPAASGKSGLASSSISEFPKIKNPMGPAKIDQDIKLEAIRPSAAPSVSIAVKSQLQSLLAPSLEVLNKVVQGEDTEEPSPIPSAFPLQSVDPIATDIDNVAAPIKSKVAHLAPVAVPTDPDFDHSAEVTRRFHCAREWLPNGRPAWAQQDFDVLLFDVSGLTLAVPLISLGQIYPLTDELTPIFGQSAWFLGLLPTSQGRIRVINTALYVMPERYREESKATLKYVVSLDGCNWGLAVDQVHQPIRLQVTQVNWRTARAKRPWLAGTVRSAMCALIDIPALLNLLQQSEDKTVR